MQTLLRHFALLGIAFVAGAITKGKITTMSASQEEIAHEILARVVGICPTFRPYWDDPKNCFRNEEGFFTNGGVFSEFSSFFRECHDQLSQNQLRELGRLVLECERDFRNGDAVYTMFMENIAGDPSAATLAPYLSPSAIQFLDQWCK